MFHQSFRCWAIPGSNRAMKTEIKLKGKSFIVGFDEEGRPFQTPKRTKKRDAASKIANELRLLNPIKHIDASITTINDSYRCAGCHKKQRIAKSLHCRACKKTDNFCSACLDKRIDQKTYLWIIQKHKACAGDIRNDPPLDLD